MNETKNQPKKSRIFIAIPTSTQLQQKVGDWQKPYAAAYPHTAAHLRFISSHNLHLTLIPPWYANPEEIAAIQKKLQQIKVAPFNLHFEQITFGPSARQPRLIWASGKTPPAIIDLKKSLESALAGTSSISAEKRPYLLHLTLARFRPEDFKHFEAKDLNEKVDWQETVSSFALMESRLSPKGAEYNVLLWDE
jgi:2'-5' RNA ligase